MCKIHSREVVQQIFIYRITFSTEFCCNFGGVLLEKILLLQHIIVKIILRNSVFIPRTILHLSTCHVGTSNFPSWLVQCQTSEQATENDFTHIFTVKYMHHKIYNSQFSFHSCSPYKCDSSDNIFPGTPLHLLYQKTLAE